MAVTDHSHHLSPFRQKYVEPNDKEGFSEIIRVNFVPQFKDDRQAAVYKTYLLDS